MLTTIDGPSYKVEYFEVGVTQSTKTGFFVDPEDNEPIIDEGDDIVFVNYIVTNTSSDTIPLGASLVTVEERYDDWPFLQAMDTISDSDLFEQQDVNSSPTKPDSHTDPYILDWEPGTFFSFGSNFHHQKDSGLEISTGMTPVDGDGDLLHDDKQEESGTATIS